MAQRDSKHEMWVRDLNARLAAMYYEGAPRHVLDRMGMLLGYRDVLWIDGNLEIGRSTTDGTIILFTEHLVAVATLKHEPRRARESSNPESSTEVSVFPRSALREVKLIPMESEPHLNTAHVWEQLHDEQPIWPGAGYAPLLALYEGVQLKLVRNEGLNGDEGTRLYQALVSDLVQN